MERSPEGPSTDNDRPVYRVMGGGGGGGVARVWRRHGGPCGRVRVCAEQLGGAGFFDPHFSSSTHTGGPPWDARAGRDSSCRVGCAVPGEFIQRTYPHAVLPSSNLVRTQLHRLYRVGVQRSPSLTSRARLLALYPALLGLGSVSSAEREVAGRRVRAGRGFLCRVWGRSAQLCSVICGRRRGRT